MREGIRMNRISAYLNKLWLSNIGVETIIVIPMFIVSYSIALMFMASNAQMRCDTYNQPIHWAYTLIGYNLSGPSAMLACGHGFQNPSFEENSPLGNFLLCRTDKLNKEDIPEDIQTTSFHYMQKYHIYLIFLVGLFWAVAGVSHSSLIYLFSLFFALSILFFYGILRLGCGRVISIIFALFFAISLPHLSELWYLRDYSKSTFFLLQTFLLILPVRQNLKLKGLFALVTLTGIVLGLCIGFRIDLLIFAFYYPVVILFFLKRKIAFRWRIALAGVFLLSFMVTASPIYLHLSSDGSNLAHVFILGLGTTFDNSLYVHGNHYQFLYLYSDGIVANLIRAHSMLKNETRVFFFYPNVHYDQVSMDYFLCVVKNFPADMVVRAYSAVSQVFAQAFRHAGNTYEMPMQFKLLAEVRRGFFYLFHYIRPRKSTPKSTHFFGHLEIYTGDSPTSINSHLPVGV